MKKITAFAAAVLCVTALLLPLKTTAAGADTAFLEQTIIDSCVYGSNADISQWELTEAELEDLFYDLWDTGRLPWYADTYYYYYMEDTGLVTEFEPENLDPEIYDRTAYEQALASVMDVCVKEGMTELQIALSVHDYLVANTVYDESMEANTGYDLLINGTTVCAGYTDLYTDILNRAGVSCVSVTSEPMEHTWNLVNIDGSWYHVDVTWDDPTPDVYGYVSHEYFLLTDEQISAGEDPHYDWVTDITCTDTRFSDAWWRETESQICYLNSDTACLQRSEDWVNSIVARDESTGQEQVLYTEKEDYIDIGYGEYIYTHMGLSLWADRLYFCGMDAVYSIATDGSDLRVESRYSTAVNRRHIYSCFVTDDTAYLTVADHDGNTSDTTVKLANSGAHTHSYTQQVQAPGCTESGHTVSICSCGLTCESLPVEPVGHDYRQTGGEAATLFAGGFAQEVCDACGDEQIRHLPKLSIIDWLLENIHIATAAAAVIGAVIGLIMSRGKNKTKAR